MKSITDYILLLMFLFFSGCSKDETKDPGDNTELFNETCQELTFEGLQISIDGNVTPLMTPGGVTFNNYMTCIQNCAQTDPDDPSCMMNCLSSSGMVPNGGAFTLVVYVKNTTDQEITFTVLPGTWFIPGSGDYQPMLVVKTIIIKIMPDCAETRGIPVFCLASDKSPPDESSGYTICDLVSLKCLKDIIAILQSKDFSAISFTETMEIQQIIWNCTEGEEVDWAYLNALP